MRGGADLSNFPVNLISVMKDSGKRIQKLEERLEAVESALEEIRDMACEQRGTMKVLRQFPISLHPDSKLR